MIFNWTRFIHWVNSQRSNHQRSFNQIISTNQPIFSFCTTVHSLQQINILTTQYHYNQKPSTRTIRSKTTAYQLYHSITQSIQNGIIQPKTTIRTKLGNRHPWQTCLSTPRIFRTPSLFIAIVTFDIQQQQQQQRRSPWSSITTPWFRSILRLHFLRSFIHSKSPSTKHNPSTQSHAMQKIKETISWHR